MDLKKISEFSDRYQNMEDSEIALLNSQRENLTEEACAALDSVISNRRIDLERLYKEEADGLKEFEAEAEKKAIQKTKRSFRLAIIVIIIMIPIHIYLAFNNLLKPEIVFSSLLIALVAGFAGKKKN